MFKLTSQVKNILFVHNPRRAPFSFGGIERVTLMLAEWLAAHGCRIYTLAVGFDSRLDNMTCITTPRRKMSDRAYCRFVVETVGRYGIDAVVCQGGHLKHIDSVRRSIPSRIPIVYCNHSQILWEVVRSVQGFDRFHRKGLLLSLRRRFKAWKARRRTVARYCKMYDAVDRYAVLCQGYVDDLYRAVGERRAQERKSRALYNPVPNETVEVDLAAKRRQLLFVGRLSYSDKRIDILLSIWNTICRDFPDWELLIVGDGEERAALEGIVASQDIRNVRFCGYASDPSQYYRDASVVCLTSMYEGWPMVLSEAQQYAAVPVAFGCSAGVREILSDGGGRVVEPFDSEAYAAALRELMSDDAKREDLARSAQLKCRRYAIDRVGESWVEMLSELERE